MVECSGYLYLFFECIYKMDPITGVYFCVSLGIGSVRYGTPCVYKGNILLIDSYNQLIQWNPDDFTYSNLFPNKFTPSLIRSIVTVGNEVLLIGHNIFKVDFQNGQIYLIVEGVPQNSSAIVRENKVIILQKWKECKLILHGHGGISSVNCCQMIDFDFQTGKRSLIIKTSKDHNTELCVYEINPGI
jgi:hypothetical protein